ncbi:dTDP-4-dehydrorhamnose reductase [Acinetobacter baumannii]|uniref:dTDP-4-dehydrorhamnose reductase n=1 Tax=Acinetobacter baumannii TaxID=470 RepID=UPI0038911B0B
MKILLLGKNGQVGWELQRALAPLGDVIALDRHGLDSLSGDMTQPQAIYDTILAVQPDVVVNASAYTAVDLAETEQELADIINHQTVKAAAEACQKTNALLVHYSTDYVFEGTGTTAFVETDAIAPLNVYGKTKALGEQAIVDSGCRYLIFRTSWVYASRAKNFLKTMLSLAQQREELSIIDDQIGAPTSAELIADITAHAIPQTIVDANKVGIYHLVASGETSWFGYANYAFIQARTLGQELAIQKVNPIPTSAYPTPATRPHNSRLDNQKIQRTFGLTLPVWQEGVKRALTELLKK